MRAKLNTLIVLIRRCLLAFLIYKIRCSLACDFCLILMQMIATLGGKLTVDVPMLLAFSLMAICLIFTYFNKLVFWLVNCDLIASGAIFILLVVPGVPLVHLDCQFFDIFYAQICDRMPAFSFGQLSKSRDANQECCLAYTLFMSF